MIVSSGRFAAAMLIGLSLHAAPVIAQEPKPDAKPEFKAGPLTVVQPWARATPGGAKVGGGFLEIRSAPGTEDKLLGAKSPVAQTIELHDHIRDGGVMRMRRVDAIPVPGGKSVQLKPGGLHLMFLELKQELKEGEKIEIVLQFEKAGELKIQMPVAKIGAMGGPNATNTGSDTGSGSGSAAGSGSGSAAKK